MIAVASHAPGRAAGRALGQAGTRAPRRVCSAKVRRRRCQLAAVVVTGLAASVVWTLLGLAGWFGNGPLAVPGPAQPRLVPVVAVVHIVEPGDTLWSIARSMQPHGEIRPLVDRLEAQTHGHPLQSGDRIVLP